MLPRHIATNRVQDALRILLGATMVFAAISHATFAREGFQAQVPDWVPLGKDLVVLLSGVVELALGLGMIFGTHWKVWIGLALGVFFILIFPGNVNQYVHQIDALTLDTDRKRFIRLFFQPVLVLWALWSTGALKALLQRRKG
ncbi:MAG: hypothetical protein Q7P63_02735 [Verrucomicrobiota bacterium JB022]|nr:hypothetical protein [Verrucomicrobiota bacterium JB022]